MPWLSTLTPMRRALRWHRRLFAAAFAAAAVYCALTVLTGRDDTTPVAAAARAIPGGAVLTAEDLTVLRLPTDALPEGGFSSPHELVGRTVVAPVPARGVLTVSALSSSGNLVAPGRLALPVSFDASAPLGLLQVGDRIDLLGGGPTGAVDVIAKDARVVAIPGQDGGGLLAADSRVVLVDLSREEAARVVGAAAGTPLGFALH